MSFSFLLSISYVPIGNFLLSLTVSDHRVLVNT